MGSAPRPCKDCGTLTTGTRCPRCEAGHQATRNATRPWYGPAWRAESAAILKAWRARYGDVCPGDQDHPPHPCTDLTVDHGPSHHSTTRTVKCRSKNSSDGARHRYNQ